MPEKSLIANIKYDFLGGTEVHSKCSLKVHFQKIESVQLQALL